MLEPRVFIKTTSDDKPYNIEFVPTMVGSLECYEMKSKDFHYGYMTEALVNKIFEQRSHSEKRYIDSFNIVTDTDKNSQLLQLKNKIILDLPSDINENIAFNGFYFHGLKYTDDVKKEPIVLKVKNFFALSGGESPIEFVIPDNKLNCNAFHVKSVNRGPTIIELNAPNGNIEEVTVYSLSSPNNDGEEVRLSVTFDKEWGELYITNFYLPSYPGESGYLRIKTGHRLSLIDGGINSDNQKDLDLLLLESSKEIIIAQSYFIFAQTDKYLQGRPFVGLSGDGSLNLQNGTFYLKGLVQNDYSLELLGSGSKGNPRESKFFITDSTFKSPTTISLPKGVKSLVISDTLIDNKDKETALKGDIKVLGSELIGDGKKKLSLTNSKLRWSKLINFGSIKGAVISNTFLENCKITNRSDGTDGVIIGTDYYSLLDDKDKNENTDILHTIKNCEIDIGKDGEFLHKTNIVSRIENSIFRENYRIINYVNDFNLTLLNSIFNNAKIELEKAPGDSTLFMTIKNCEFSGSSSLYGVKEIESSIVKDGVALSGYEKVCDSFLENIKKDGKNEQVPRLIGFSSNEKETMQEANFSSASQNDIKFL